VLALQKPTPEPSSGVPFNPRFAPKSIPKITPKNML
jgi:hypothetical protein